MRRDQVYVYTQAMKTEIMIKQAPYRMCTVHILLLMLRAKWYICYRCQEICGCIFIISASSLRVYLCVCVCVYWACMWKIISELLLTLRDGHKKRSWKLGFSLHRLMFLARVWFFFLLNLQQLMQRYLVTKSSILCNSVHPNCFWVHLKCNIQIPGFVRLVTCNITLQDMMEFNIKYIY